MVKYHLNNVSGPREECLSRNPGTPTCSLFAAEAVAVFEYDMGDGGLDSSFCRFLVLRPWADSGLLSTLFL